MRILLIFCLSSIIVRAQHLLPVQYDTTVHSFELITYGIADFGSTSIQNDFSDKFIFGGAISDEIKNSSWERQKGINRIGADVQTELEFRNYKSNLFKKDRFGWLVKGGYYNFGGLLYAKDLFGLAFYGNQRYLGETIDFSGSRGGFWQYQKLGFGVIDKKTKSNLSLNAYSVSTYAGSNISSGMIYQSSTGDSMHVIYNGSAENLNSGFSDRGWGLGVDADIRIPVQLMKGQTSYIQFLVKNIGLAYLPSITKYEADSAFSFQGFTLDQLINNNSVLNSMSDLSDTLNITSDTISSFRFLPAYFQVGKMIDDLSSKKLQSFFGARLYPSLVLVPQIYVGIHYKPAKWVSLGANAAFGGYTNLRFGFYSSFKLSKFDLGVCSENIVDSFSAMGRGRSVIVRLRWQI